MDSLLITIGELKQTAKDTHDKVDALNIKVGIQNGRVGRLENWKSFVLGMGAILTLLVIPMAMKYFPEIINSIIGSK